ncbi:MAG: acetoacetate decarboxylase family protein [Pseudomonadales bacterium]
MAKKTQFTIEGRELSYPTRFWEGSSLLGIFLVPLDAANKIIAASGFKAARLLPGKAGLIITGVHYTDSACEQYEELAFAFFVEEHPATGSRSSLYNLRLLAKGKLPSYTWYLPVTSTLAQQCGIQMWGYPKTIEDLRFSQADQTAEIALHRDGEKILSYSVKAKGKSETKESPAPVYSVYEGQPQVGYLMQKFSQAGYRPGGGKLVISDHPLMQPLRELGLPKKPLLSGWMGQLDFTMSAPALLENPSE